MSDHQHIFQPATILRVNAIGAPGERTFFLQGGDAVKLVSLLIEKVQVQVLAAGAIRLINQIEAELFDFEKSLAKYDEAEMQLVMPVDPLFKVDEVALGYDQEKDLFLLQVAEEGPEEKRQQVLFWATREKMHGLALWALELARRGRPESPLQEKPSGNGFRHGNNGHKS